MADCESMLQERILDALAENRSLEIRGGGTKHFLGRRTEGEILEVRGHAGIVDYDPKELVLTARCGTRLSEIEAVLAQQNQMLPFEPPHFGENATIGGTIACGLSGPRRPWAGAARDYLLGAKILNGMGELLHFGGKVMKNVAGFDCARLMAGAYGTLGVLLETSVKVLPVPAHSVTRVMECPEDEAVRFMSALLSQPVPVDGAAWCDGLLHVRLSGSFDAVSHARIGGEELPDAARFWFDLREQRLEFFRNEKPLWRISSKPAQKPFDIPGNWLLDWGGALRWFKSAAPEEEVRKSVARSGGRARLFGGEDSLLCDSPNLIEMSRRIKHAFDPHGICNPGRMHRGI